MLPVANILLFDALTLQVAQVPGDQFRCRGAMSSLFENAFAL
jgi:hypothetical protein